MGRIWKKYSTVLAILSLLTLLSAWSTVAWAGSQEQTAKASGKATPNDEPTMKPKSSHSVGDDGIGFKGFAISLDQADGDPNLHLKTAVLVKPLKTDHFFVAFAASTPLLKNNGSSTDGLYVSDRSMDRSPGAGAFNITRGPRMGSDWVVLMDWPQADRLLPVAQEMHFSWMPEMRGKAGWHSKMELIFLPADQWTVRAILSMAQGAPEYRHFLSSDDPHSARIGMTIDVAYQMFNTIALGFDYGQYRYGRTFRAAEISPAPSNPDGPVRSESFTARLTIRF